MRPVDMSGDELLADQDDAQEGQGGDEDEAKELSTCVNVV